MGGRGAGGGGKGGGGGGGGVATKQGLIDSVKKKQAILNKAEDRAYNHISRDNTLAAAKALKSFQNAQLKLNNFLSKNK